MLFKNISEVRIVLKLSDSTTFDRLAPHLAQAEYSFIRPALGSDMYAALLTYYNSENRYMMPENLYGIGFSFNTGSIGSVGSGTVNDLLTPEERAWALLLHYTQRAIAHIALWKGFDSLNTYISDGGFKRSETEKIKSLFKYQEDHLKAYFQESGIDGLDIILGILEERIAYFPAYKNQMYKHRGRIIHDTKTFNEIFYINNSRIIFDRLRQHMKTVEELYLIKYIGAEHFNYIIAELQKESPAAKVLAIMPYLRDPVAYKSTAMLMEESGAELTQRGLYMKGQKNISNSDLIVNTDEARVKELIKRNHGLADQYFERLRAYLSANATEWSQASENPRYYFHNRDNSGKRTFFT